MKPEEIEIGSIYINPARKGYRYLGCGKRVLGCGKRVMWEGAIYHCDKPNFSNKQLVVIETPDDNLGMFIQQPPDCFDGAWYNFVKESRPMPKNDGTRKNAIIIIH